MKSLPILVLLLAAAQGCSIPKDLPEAPSEEIRSQLGRIRVKVLGVEPEARIEHPPVGCCNGFCRGMEQAFVVFDTGDSGSLAGLAAPILMFVYGPIGAFRSMAVEDFERLEAPIRRAFMESRVGDTLGSLVLQEGRQQKDFVVLGMDDPGSADTILRIAVDHKNLILPRRGSASMKVFLNPFLKVSLRLRVSLERRSDLHILYDETLRFESSSLNFEQWSLNDGEQVRLAIVEGRRWLAGKVSSIILKPVLEAPGRQADEKE